MLGPSPSTTSLPSMKLKPFGVSKKKAIVGGYDSNKFCKNGKIKRKYRRRIRHAEQRRLDFRETKRKLLAQRKILLPKKTKTQIIWARRPFFGKKCRRFQAKQEYIKNMCVQR